MKSCAEAHIGSARRTNAEESSGEKNVGALKPSEVRLQNRVEEILAELETEGGYVRGVEFSNRLVEEGIDRKLGMNVALKGLGQESVRIKEAGGQSIVVLRVKKKGGGETEVMISPKKIEYQILVDIVREIVEDYYKRGTPLTIPEVARKVTAGRDEEVADKKIIRKVRHIIENKNDLKNKIRMREHMPVEEFQGEVGKKLKEVIIEAYNRGEPLTMLEVAKKVAVDRGEVADKKFIRRIRHTVENRKDLRDKIRRKRGNFSVEKFQELVKQLEEIIVEAYNKGEPLTIPEVTQKIAAFRGEEVDQKYKKGIRDLINRREHLRNKVKIREWLPGGGLEEKVAEVIKESYNRGELLTKQEIGKKWQQISVWLRIEGLQKEFVI